MKKHNSSILKHFSIKEGHYTGLKGMKEMPKGVITKSLLAGLGIGSIIGAKKEDLGVKKGMKNGALIGLVSGIFINFMLKKFHEPMSTVKYDKVDKYIRTKISLSNGIEGVSNKGSKSKVEDLFSFNDSNFLNYKVNISIQKSSVTMYLYDFSDNEFQNLDQILNRYCYEYHGMEYSSHLLDREKNSYSINIIFTNHYVIAEFLIEVAKTLNTKINLLDNRVPINISQEEIALNIPNIPKQEKAFSSIMTRVKK